MAKQSQQLVLAFFDAEAAADAAVAALKQWDKATDAIKLGAIGVLVKDEKGKIKTHKLGSRKTGKGALIFGLVGLLSGGMTVVGGLDLRRHRRLLVPQGAGDVQGRPHPDQHKPRWRQGGCCPGG